MHSNRSDHGMVRREGRSDHFNSNEHTVEAVSSPAPSDAQNVAGGHTIAFQSPMCEINYTFGEAGKTVCKNENAQRIMDEEGMCLSTARVHCPDHSCISSDLPFTLNETTDYDLYPRGCFFTTDGIWRYNPAGYTPDITTTGFSGTPVCEEVQFINGTHNSNHCGNDDYEPLMNEFACRNAATCIGARHPVQFRDLNHSMQNVHPKGCHYETYGDMRSWVMFNPCDNLTDGTPNDPNLRGQIICSLKPSSQEGVSSPSPTPAPAR